MGFIVSFLTDPKSHQFSMKTTADIYAHLDMSAKNTAAVALAHLFRLDEDDEAEE